MSGPANRRGFLRRVAALGSAAGAAVAGCGARLPGGDDGGGRATDGGGSGGGGTGRSPTDDGVGALAAETLATGFVSPVGVEVPRDGDRLYVVDQPGRIYLVEGGDLRDRPFLDLRDRVVDLSGYDERGLLGLALHPSFADNGRLYVRYSAPRREGTPSSYSHTFVLSEFRVDPGARSVPPSEAEERTLLEIPQPQSNHNAGAVLFGPDDYLYVGVGDGGGSNDAGRGHVDDWYDVNAGGNGQDVERNLLGSVLRIDVSVGDGDRPYGVPDDNPLVGRPGANEQYAWGLRNPWRMSFDGADDADLYAADVGQGRYEEVNRIEAGGNYGWNVREGAHCFDADDCPPRTPDDVRGGEPLVDPIIEYSHGGEEPSGIAVIGGYRYRGEAIPDLRGRYVFADWRADGRLFVAREVEEGPWPISVVPVAGGAVGRYVLAFGRAPDGELFVLTSDERGVGGETGALHRLRPND